MPYLTKSRFKIALECVNKLDYQDDVSFENSLNNNSFFQALAEGGHQVGALARTIFPGGTEITAEGHDAQIAATNDLLARDQAVIYEAAISYDNFFLRADILVKKGEDIYLHEVKAKSYSSIDGEKSILGVKKNVLSEFKPYLYDAAFQRHVLRLAKPGKRIHTFLIMPDKTKACTQGVPANDLKVTKNGRMVDVTLGPALTNGDLAREIFASVPVDEYLDALEREDILISGKSFTFAEAINEFSRRLENAQAPLPGSHCRKCEFRLSSRAEADLKDGRDKCWSTYFEWPEEPSLNTVFDLYSLSGKRISDLVSAKKGRQIEVLEEDIDLKIESKSISTSHRQWLQCTEARGEQSEPFLIDEPLVIDLDKLSYPVHFIDFETARFPIPLHSGRKPYELVFFQFSHHRIDSDGSITHVSEFLSTDADVFPNFVALRALAGALGNDQGSVVHWWDHERTVLKEVQRQLAEVRIDEVPDRDDLNNFLDHLLNSGRLFDLGRGIFHKYAFLPKTQGSSSIKKALPALLPHCPGLVEFYSKPIYGAANGIKSSNYTDHIWIQHDKNGGIIDLYELLGHALSDELGSKKELDDELIIANGGMAMVAYSFLVRSTADEATKNQMLTQLKRYCELDTLATAMIWQGLRELTNRRYERQTQT